MATPKLPNHPDNYMVPSAISIWYAPLNDDGSLGTFLDMGNVFDISLALTDEYLDHESSRGGLMSTDKSVLVKVDGEIKFTVDELVGKNLELMFRPNVTPDATAVYTVFDRKRLRLTAADAQTIDRLAVETDETDYLDLSNVVVQSADGVVTYTAVTDYTFTQASGPLSVRVPASIARVLSGSIPDGSEVTIKYEYDRESTKYILQSGANAEGAMRVQLLNRIGPMCAYFFPFISVRVDGDITINPAEWMKQAFTCKILTDGQGSRGDFYLFDAYNKLQVA